MAPAILVESDDTSSPGVTKPTVYVMDALHPKVIEYCRQNFNAILPGTPGHASWREKAQYLLIKSASLPAADVEACQRLLAVGKQGVGIDKIDADACAARGVKIFNTPGINARAVAELVLALTTSVARTVGSITARQHAGEVVPKGTCRGLILHKRTLGLIGMGNIGKTVARIFRGAFDSPVVAYDPFMPADAWADLPHTRAGSVAEVLRQADVLSIHVPLTDETRDMISYAELQTMKREAILINTARGGIVNEQDLERAVREGLIWGAGLDCHEQEPPSKERYGGLWDAGEVVSTPHIGAATEQTQIETGIAAARRLLEYALAKGI